MLDIPLVCGIIYVNTIPGGKKMKKHYVIKDREGNYIAPGNFITPTTTEQGWHYLKFRERDCTGFVFYSRKDTAEKEIGYLKDLGHDFYLEVMK